MNNLNSNENYDEHSEISSFKDYLNLIRNNLGPVVIILVASAVAAIIYALKAPDIFKANTTLRITKPGGSILRAPMLPEFSDYGSDRFIANEIEIFNLNPS